jgi:hypothetical protein
VKPLKFLALLALLGTVPAAAQERIAPSPAQVKECNAEARNRQLENDQKSDFIRGCLKEGSESSSAGASSEEGPLKERIAECERRADQGRLQGSTRRESISACLGGDGAIDASSRG